MGVGPTGGIALAPSVTRAKILVVDDDAMNVELFVDSLAADGHDVIVERDGVAGRDRALREPFDVVILDIQLPGMDGYAVCRELRAAGIASPILALSSAALAEQVQRGQAAGFDSYLTKPISLSAHLMVLGSVTLGLV